MYRNPTLIVPPRPGSAVPFSYQVVPYTAPGTPPPDDRGVPGGSAGGAAGRSRYDFSSEQTVEDLIARGYLAIPTGDPVTAMLTDKRHTTWLGLDDAIRLIRTRQDAYRQNMDGILYATAAATNALHTWEAERGWPSDRQLDNTHKTLQNLYAQQREERVSLWRDIARVRATLPEVVQLHLAAHRKLDLLDDTDGDAP